MPPAPAQAKHAEPAAPPADKVAGTEAAKAEKPAKAETSEKAEKPEKPKKAQTPQVEPVKAEGRAGEVGSSPADKAEEPAAKSSIGAALLPTEVAEPSTGAVQLPTQVSEEPTGAEEPKPEAPGAEKPKPETPKTGQAKPEMPKTETLKTEALKTEPAETGANGSGPTGEPAPVEQPDADTTQVISDTGRTQVIDRNVVAAADQAAAVPLAPMVALPRDTPMQGHEVFAVAAPAPGDNRKKVLIALGALVVVAGLVWWLLLAGGDSGGGGQQQAAPPAQVGDPGTIVLPGTPDPRSGTMSLSQAQTSNVFSAREVGLLTAVGVNAVTYVGSYEGTTAYLVQAFPNPDAAAAAKTTTGVLDANHKLNFPDRTVDGLPADVRAVGTTGPASSLARVVYTAGTWTVQVSILQSPSGDPALLDQQLRTLVTTVGQTLPPS